MIRSFLSAATLVLLPWAAQAADPLSPFGKRVVQSVTRDFNGDGKPDVAALVREDDRPVGQDEMDDEEKASGNHRYALKVFLGGVPKAVIDRANFWNPGEARFSGRGDLPKTEEATLESPKPGMLWLRASGGGEDDAMRLVAKFRWEKSGSPEGRFRLVGEEAKAHMKSDLWVFAEEARCWEQVSGRVGRTLSVNYLTGKATGTDASTGEAAISADGATASDVETIHRIPYKIAQKGPVYLDTYEPDRAPAFQERYWNPSQPKPKQAKICPRS